MVFAIPNRGDVHHSTSSWKSCDDHERLVGPAVSDYGSGIKPNAPFLPLATAVS